MLDSLLNGVAEYSLNKTTGKGCAWRISSKKISERLIAEGIIDKKFVKEKTRSGYRLFSAEKYPGGKVYVTWYLCSGLADEELWTPSFIDAGIWERGASKFRRRLELDKNVETYLLPEMGDYLQNISDVELVSMVRDYLIEHGIINVPISRRKGNTYYFNENEVYSLDTKSELFPYEKRIELDLFSVAYETCFNMLVWRKAVAQFEVGMTLGECISIFLKTELGHDIS